MNCISAKVWTLLIEDSFVEFLEGKDESLYQLLLQVLEIASNRFKDELWSAKLIQAL